MLTVFEKIPDLFVQVYDPLFQQWARNFKRVGKKAVLKFRKPLEPSALATDRRRIVGVVLLAEVERNAKGVTTRVTIRPADEANEEAIRRHTAELRAEMLH